MGGARTFFDDQRTDTALEYLLSWPCPPHCQKWWWGSPGLHFWSPYLWMFISNVQKIGWLLEQSNLLLNVQLVKKVGSSTLQNIMFDLISSRIKSIRFFSMLLCGSQTFFPAELHAVFVLSHDYSLDVLLLFHLITSVFDHFEGAVVWSKKVAMTSIGYDSCWDDFQG